jgi:hypothetical protein
LVTLVTRRTLPLRGNPGCPAFSAFLARSLHCEGTPAFPLSPFSWPVPSHCEGTPAFPLSPSSWPVPSHCEGTPAFPLSLFFLARSLPLRGNLSRFPSTLLSRAPKQEEPAASRSDRSRRNQQRPGPTGRTEEPAESRSDRNNSKYEPRSPPTPARSAPPGHGHRPRKVPAPPGTYTPFLYIV